METAKQTVITVETIIDAPVDKVWKIWNDPKHITQWNNASDDWHTPQAENDLRVGGQLRATMAAKDGSMSFEFIATYDKIVPNKSIDYTIEDGRKVTVEFSPQGSKTKVVESFEAEGTNPVEMQRDGWQAILDNFKKHTERLNKYHQLDFSITIDASLKKVWDIMLSEKTYRQWVGAAWPGSYFEGEWKEGETLCFFNSEKSGTKAKLIEHRPYQFSRAEHVSCFDKGKEDTSSSIARSWIGCTESYAFSERNGHTTVKVTMHVTADWVDMFNTDWPKALAKLKEICE